MARLRARGLIVEEVLEENVDPSSVMAHIEDERTKKGDRRDVVDPPELPWQRQRCRVVRADLRILGQIRK